MEDVEVMSIPLGADGVQHIGVNVGDDLFDLLLGHAPVHGDGHVGHARHEVSVNAPHRVLPVQDDVGLRLGGSDFALVVVRHGD